MTEDEARQTRCHQAMQGGFEAHCVGSKCMAWRWDKRFGDPPKSKEEGGIMLPREAWPGYCGLAGKP